MQIKGVCLLWHHRQRGENMAMQTMQIRLTDKQIKRVDLLVKKGVYPNRSEAVRDAVRKLVGNGE